MEHVYVRESLAAADPFYGGPMPDLGGRVDTDVFALAPEKALRDLGRIERDLLVSIGPHVTGPVGGEGPEPTLDASSKREAI